MSVSPAFKTVIYFEPDGVFIYTLEKKKWVSIEGTYLMDKLPEDGLAKQISDGAVLAVVSDSFCGHMQLEVANKKDEYSDENIGKILQKEHQIDLDAYEFASQKFPLGRSNVQISVSGIEKEAHQQVEAWLAALGTKKSWIIPFGWFVAALKSVEPVLMAVIRDENQVLVSHHYLGVDDAREIKLADVKDYALARQQERKETHLMYVHGDPKLRSSLEEQVGEAVAVHALISDDSADPLESLTGAVLTKGSEVLGELLHFVGGESVMADTKASKKSKSSKVEELEKKEEEKEVVEPKTEEKNAEETPVTDDLPKPVPPAQQGASALTESAGRTVVEVEDSDEVAPVDEAKKEEKVEQDEKVEQVQNVVPAAPVEQELKPLSDQLHLDQKAVDSSTRYQEVEKRSSWKGPVLVFLAVALITGVVGGAVLWSQQSWSPGPALLPDTSTPTPTPEPVEEEEEEDIVVSEFTDEQKEQTSVLVLNATGTAGLAGRVRQNLVSAGWTNVSVGNAEGTYDGATFVFTEIEEAIPALSQDLGIELRPTAQLSESQADTHDVVIILAEQISLQ